MKKRIYIAAGDGIYLYEQNGNGVLSFIDQTPCGKTMYLAAEGNRMYALLYDTADSMGNGCSAVISYRIDETGRLTDPCPALSAGGACGCHLSVLDHAVYTANYVSGSVSRLPLDGSPKTVVRHTEYGIPCGPDANRQETAHPHFIAPTPDGAYLAAVDLGLDAILTYDRQLHPVCVSRLPAGCGPRHLVFSRDGKFAYCANELASTVSVLRYERETGAFVHLSQQPSYLPSRKNDEDAKHPARNYPAAIRADGAYVLVSNRGRDTAAVFRVSDGGASLACIAEMPTYGAWPRDFIVSGDDLICTNEYGNSVTVLRMNRDRTAAEPVDTAEHIPAPIAVLCTEV